MVKALNNHPIQLLKVDITELHFKSGNSSDPLYEIPEEMIKLSVGYTKINEQSTFVVGIMVEIGDEEVKTQKYFAKIKLVGNFHVDTTAFSETHVSMWAQQNAPVILLPFVREHLYSITLRAGFKPFILPLIQVPTARLIKTEANEFCSD